MTTLSDKAAVTGIGETRYERGTDKSALQLTLEASLTAIADAGLTPKDIDGVIAYASGEVVAEDLLTNFGSEDFRFSATTPLGGASAVAALQCAAMAVATGAATHVLIPLGRTGYSGARIDRRVQQMRQFRVVSEFEAPVGANAPAQYYAPMARRHMELYGTTSDQFAAVAVTMRHHATLNGNALMQTPITVADHHASRMIADPFRLLDCCLESDGGAAVVVSSAKRGRDMSQPPIFLSGMGVGHPDSPSAITQRPEMTRLGLAKAAPRAFAMAGVTHDDIDVATIYDCFTYTVICQIEDLGFCPKGEGGPFVENGQIGLGGALPTNTHGGLLSQAHVAGLNHIVELVRQLRGDCGTRQVNDAEVGLVTGYGDLGDGSIAVMHR
ncbi:MAG: thiolase family protein [Acidobacteriota bacterium]|nr:thiolase family protein [Acidobacteriota bacterium]